MKANRWLIASVFLLSGCAANIRNDATPADVTAALGSPKEIFKLKDGSSSWEYPTSPLGLTTTLARFDAEGKLLFVSQVLTDENFHRIQNGMSEEAVRATVGPPWRKVPFERLQQTAWDYLYRDTWGYRVEFSVLFNPSGEVVGKTSRRLDDSRNDSR
ncbi:MAG: outer membrane protein assembly factor BamE [Betaproteobacteria bacterium]|nr:outer membrane protein assembly factor BamE [Betaproteobacteria bacterium]